MFCGYGGKLISAAYCVYLVLFIRSCYDSSFLLGDS